MLPSLEGAPRLVSWLWPGYIASGRLTLLDGDPGVGKSLLTVDLAARLTTGRDFPDGSRPGPATVGLLVHHLRKAAAAGLSLRTLERAKAVLGMASEQRREGRRNVWYWRLGKG
jgi:hypothetical protein